MNITDPIREIARRSPHAEAVVVDDRSFAYGELEALIDAIARRALDGGLHAGQWAAVEARSAFGTFVVSLALARIGVATLPNTARDDALAARFVWHTKESTHARTFAVDETWFEAPTSPGTPLPSHQDGEALYRLFSTSGTTGLPKALAVRHVDIVTRVRMRIRALPWPEPVRLMSLIDPYMSYGFQNWIRVLWSGGTAVSPPHVGSVLAEIERRNVNYVVLTPGALKTLLETRPAGEGPLAQLARIEVSGSRISESLARDTADRLCPQLTIAYGSTEVGLVAVAPVSEILGRAGAVGRVLEGIELQSVDDARRPVPPGVDGLLRVRADAGMGRYVEANGGLSEFPDGWFYSGDLGHVEPDGMLILAGRADERINVGGAKVAPESIEAAIQTLPDILDVAAFAVPSGQGIDRVAVAIVARPTFRFDAFERVCRERLQSLAPALVLRMDTIPRNAMGKVARHELARFAQSRAPKGPESA